MNNQWIGAGQPAADHLLARPWTDSAEAVARLPPDRHLQPASAAYQSIWPSGKPQHPQEARAGSIMHCFPVDFRL